MTGAEIVTSKVATGSEGDRYYAGAQGTIDAAAIDAYFGAPAAEVIASVDVEERDRIAQGLRQRLMAWQPTPANSYTGAVAPVSGTPVNAATLAAIIDMLEA